MPDLLVHQSHCAIKDEELPEAERVFKQIIADRLQNYLQPHGFRGVKIWGTSDLYWILESALGDGTPVTAKLEVAECMAADPDGELGMSGEFCELCTQVAARKLLAAAEEIRESKKAEADPVKAGVLKSDGINSLELGSELAQVLGDAAYDLAAEIRGEQMPSYLKVSNLNPGSSTPGRFDEAIMKSRAKERKA